MRGVQVGVKTKVKVVWQPLFGSGQGCVYVLCMQLARHMWRAVLPVNLQTLDLLKGRRVVGLKRAFLGCGNKKDIEARVEVRSLFSRKAVSRLLL